jgi:hypothetical protein
MPRTTKQQQKAFYLPTELAEEWKTSAEKNHRSMNSELIVALEFYLKSQKERTKKMTLLQQVLQETGIAQVEYDGYTATAMNGQGEFGDQFSLAIQKEMMPPHLTKLSHSLFEIEQLMEETQAPKPIQWETVEPEE